MVGQTPQAYIDFVCRYGRCRYKGLATLKTKDGSSLEVSTFFGISGTTGRTIANIQAHRDYLGNRWIPFANDITNNRYVLDKQSGAVWFLNYVSSMVKTVRVADSFAEFLNRIEVEVIEM